MYKLWIFLLPFFLFAGTENGTVLLYNDSPFILTAIIQASDGTYLGEMTLQPNEQKNFTQHLAPTQYIHPGRPDVSLTPYVVIWQCPSQGFYSMCNRVSPGAMVRANDCQGLQYCSPKQEREQKPASTLKRKPQ
ncbi:MAG TPA: hypothetical protein VLE96_00330 [Chlamydiales bacterium]|nr:hypothetical protein [Chlamydiales bacterium]